VSTERIDAILQAFNSSPNKYCRAEVDEALKLREEITPRLLIVLDELVANPEKFNDEHRLLHWYAVSLLAHFKEPRAHLPIIRAFNLPPKIEHALWAEITAELLPVLLFQTCGGDVSAIKELVRDRSANQRVRCSAMDALSLAALSDVVPRQEVLAFFGGLFTEDVADRSSGLFWTCLASSATDLWPEEILPTIKKAFDDGVFCEGFIAWEDVQESVIEPMDEWLARERERALRRIPEDVHDYMSFVPCFQPPAEAQQEEASTPSEKRISSQQRALRNAKKKMAKKSRKRNRG
jgi:hypothetical protein